MNKSIDPTRLDPYVTVAIEKFSSRPLGLVALDFDGCLAPLVDVPSDARPLPESAAALAELSTQENVYLALVSGRPADVLIELANPPANTWLIGSHGAELGHVNASGDFVRDKFTLDADARDTLEQVTAALHEITNDHPRTWVEEKPAAAVLHTRQADPQVGAAARAAALAGPAQQAGVHPIEGNEVVELAVVAATKGDALTALRSDLEAHAGGPVPVLYAGDDITDETVLETLEFSDVGIKVGDAPTAARYRVADPEAIAAALRLLVHHYRKR